MCHQSDYIKRLQSNQEYKQSLKYHKQFNANGVDAKRIH